MSAAFEVLAWNDLAAGLMEDFGSLLIATLPAKLSSAPSSRASGSTVTSIS